MKIENYYEFQVSQEDLWDHFLSPEALRASIPGCKNIELIDGDTYKAELSLGIAAIRGDYTGTVQIKDKLFPRQYKMVVEGNGASGFVSGEGLIAFEAKERTATVLRYDFDIKVGGKIAGIGQRMISGISKIMAEQFFKEMDRQLKLQRAEYQPGFLEKLWLNFRTFFKRILGRAGAN
jgi:uncharacterized protein